VTDRAKKFFFDNNDFSDEALRKKLEAARKPTFSAEQMEASRKSGFEEGRKAGIQETLNSQEAQIRDALQQIVMATTHLEQEEEARRTHFIEQSALIAGNALARTLPVLLDHMAQEQILAFVKQVMDDHAKNQKLQIFLGPTHFEALEKRLKEIFERGKRKSNCAIHRDDTLGPLECRFEWTGGGAEWNPAPIAQSIIGAIAAHLPEHLRETFVTNPEGMDEPAQTPHTEPDNGEQP
jgi:flagellar assembly protein FliH